MITICSKYFYKDKKNNNRIYCIDDVNECPEGMEYLNLYTKECMEKEKVSTKDLSNFQFKVKELNNLNIIYEEIALDDYHKTKNGIKIEGPNSKLQIGTEDYFQTENRSDLGVDLTKCTEKIRFKLGIQDRGKLIYKIIELDLNGTIIVNYSVYNSDNPREPLNLNVCQGENI